LQIGSLHIEGHDLAAIGLLIFLEGVLSADNAVLLAVLAMRVPKEQRGNALKYGLVGAFVFRIACLALAKSLMNQPWLALLGGAYLCWLPYKHFTSKSDGHTAPPAARTWFGLSLFWSTVITIELTDLVFAIDSILVAVAVSDKLWVVITGALMGLVAMRFVAGGFLKLIEHYPTIVDGAYVIVAWVGVKLLIEFAHKMHWIAWEIPKVLSIGVILVIFGVSLALGHRQAKLTPAQLEEEAEIEALLEGDSPADR